MQRRSVLLGGLTLGAFNPISALATISQQLKPSPRMPVMFMGHGDPMNAIDDNIYRQTWQTLGQRFGSKGTWLKPQLILCISAHWMTNGQGFWLTGQDKPKTIHDFGGFPKKLYEQQYPAKGAPWAAKAIQTWIQPQAGAVYQGPIGVDAKVWGYDHGAWSVLLPMFPKADVPTLQLSIDMHQSLEAHAKLGQILQALRNQGVLIVGSGNVVHNLRFAIGQGEHMTDWATSFDNYVHKAVLARDMPSLTQWQNKPIASAAKMSVPTTDHYLPFIVAMAASDAKDKLTVIHKAKAAGAISMQSFVWSA